MACPDEPETTIVPDGGNVIITPPAPAQNVGASEEALARIAARIEALETALETRIGDTRQWTETTLSPLTQQLADMRADLSQAVQNLPSTMQTFREELTRKLQELQQAVEAQRQPVTPTLPEGTIIQAETTVITPPEEPPANADGTNPTAPATPAPPAARKRRVV
jgi:ABC-type transporter Mla subunit MlaD